MTSQSRGNRNAASRSKGEWLECNCPKCGSSFKDHGNRILLRCPKCSHRAGYVAFQATRSRPPDRAEQVAPSGPTLVTAESPFCIFCSALESAPGHAKIPAPEQVLAALGAPCCEHPDWMACHNLGLLGLMETSRKKAARPSRPTGARCKSCFAWYDAHTDTVDVRTRDGHRERMQHMAASNEIVSKAAGLYTVSLWFELLSYLAGALAVGAILWAFL